MIGTEKENTLGDKARYSRKRRSIKNVIESDKYTVLWRRSSSSRGAIPVVSRAALERMFVVFMFFMPSLVSKSWDI